MKFEILFENLYEDDQRIFNGSNFLVKEFGRKLSGLAENIWVKDMNLVIKICEEFKKQDKWLKISARAVFDSAEIKQISHQMVFFPKMHLSPAMDRSLYAQLNYTINPELARCYGGYEKVVIAETLNLKGKVKIEVGKIRCLKSQELIAVGSTIKRLINDGATLCQPEPIGFNRGGLEVALLKPLRFAPPLVIDQSLSLNLDPQTLLFKEHLLFKSYSMEGIPAFCGLNQITSFSRMCDSVLPGRSPFWIIENTWVDKLKLMGCRPKGYPVMETGTEFRQKYLRDLLWLKEIVYMNPRNRLHLAD